MNSAVPSLPESPGALRDLVLELRQVLGEKSQKLAERDTALSEKDATIARHENDLQIHRDLLGERDEEIEQLNETIALLRAKRFRHSSEKSDSLQINLFDESELETAIAELEARLAEEQEARRAARSPRVPSTAPPSPPSEPPRRKPLPAHFRRVTIDIDVNPGDKERMGDQWTFIGWDRSEQLAVQEREYFVKEYRRAKYVKNTAADEDAPGAPIKVAPPPAVMLPKSMADASLLAKMITGKFVDALSFYREQKVLEREGVEVGYSTLCSYPIQLHERLEPLKTLLYDEVARSSLWHLDETQLQVLREPGRDDRKSSYLWAIRAGPSSSPIVLFHYDQRRSYEALDAWLGPIAEQFNGVIVSDEHKPYQRFAETYPGIEARGGCWSHCRRKFVDAVKGRRHTSHAHRVLEQIAKLYRLEDKLGDLTGEERARARQQSLGPHLQTLLDFVDGLAPAYANKGLMQKAIGYLRNNWSSLTAFLDHGDLPLDNNPIENAIRPFTVGRRNWLFSGSPRGAQASAFMYSLVETAKANGWEPKAYLQTLFEAYPLAKNNEQRRALLPMFAKKP